MINWTTCKDRNQKPSMQRIINMPTYMIERINRGWNECSPNK